MSSLTVTQRLFIHIEGFIIVIQRLFIYIESFLILLQRLFIYKCINLIGRNTDTIYFYREAKTIYSYRGLHYYNTETIYHREFLDPTAKTIYLYIHM